MKFKFFLAIILALTLAVGLYGWFHRAAPAMTSKPMASQPAKPASVNPAEPVVTAPAKPVPAMAPKMVTVVMPTEVSTSSIAPLPSTDWSAVKVIVDNRAGYKSRLDAIRSLSKNLTDSDWNQLKPFLLKPDALDRVQLGQVLKNELLDVLCAMDPPPAGLGDVLSQIYHSHQQDDVVRDYAVQHLGAYYEQMAAQPTNTNALQSALAVLWEATSEIGDSVGGTALLALKRLSQQYDGIDQGKIASTAMQMATDSRSGELTRITAYQVFAQLGDGDALPVVLQAAQTGETIPVRVSAIGALGLLGGSEQISFLQNLLAGTEDRLKPAAKHALEQITARQNRLTGQK